MDGRSTSPTASDITSVNSESPHCNGCREDSDAAWRCLRVAEGMAKSLTTCSVDAWFRQYAPRSLTRWSDSDIDGILRILEETDMLKADGSHISTISKAVAQHIKTTKGLSPTTRIEYTPHECSVPEVPSYAWFPNVRSTLIESQTIDQRQRQSGSVEPTAYESMAPESGQPQVPQAVALEKARLNTRDDGKYERGEEQKTGMNLSDVAAVGEVKRGEGQSDRRDNELKICGGATELLYNDPCRRFVNGFTIERRRMRLWRFERTHVCVSKEFSFHRTPGSFLRFLLYLLFSSPRDLGFDPNVRRYFERVPEETDPSSGASSDRYEIAYRYQVGNRYFLTQGPPISDQAAYWVVSQATRVWRVREMYFPDPSNKHEYTLGEPMALKDAYLFEDAVLDSGIKEQIMASLRDAGADDKDAARYFMEYEIDEVALLPNENETGLEDDLTSDMVTNKPASYTPKVETPDIEVAPASSLRDSQRTSTSHADASHPDPSDSTEATQWTDRSATQETLPRRYRRKHVRTIFKHVCQSMYELSDWDTFVQCMRHLIKGLDYMRRAGWVHRDISGGNCLWDPASRQGKLADLEFARPYKHESLLPHEARTGTPAFMAVEYQRRKYLYSVVDVPTDDIFATSPKREYVQRLTFTYNFYHDLESLIWLYAWAVYFRPPLLRVPPSSGTAELLRREGHQFFACGIEGNFERWDAVKDGPRANQLNTDVINAVVYGPTSGCRFLAGGMQTIRHLAQRYYDIQSLPTNDSLRNGTAIWSADHFTYDVYEKFDELLGKVADLIKEVGDTFPMRHISSRREKTKRHRTEDPDSPTHHSGKGNKRVKRSGES